MFLKSSLCVFFAYFAGFILYFLYALQSLIIIIGLIAAVIGRASPCGLTILTFPSPQCMDQRKSTFRHIIIVHRNSDQIT